VTIQNNLGVAIVGCGLIGKKRAQALSKADLHGGARLIACADVVLERAREVAQTTPGAIATADWHDVVRHEDVAIVVVATTNDMLAEITLAAVQAGKHVLVEKPAARHASEVEPVMGAAQQATVQVRVGFNHRYHPALLRARELLDAGVLGDMMFVRGRYGHGGRRGYEREWRANPELSGGGELLDQGVHIIDLARLFLGDFDQVIGFAHTYFWDMPVDDNGFMLLRTPQNQTAFLHVSCTEWKNLFSLEVYGKQGKLHIEGLGGSYGTERLTHYQMRPQMGPPDTTCWEYPRGDESWALEFAEFLDDIRLKRTPAANLNDAYAALTIVEKIYAESGYDHHA
jgi:predicted dehydrogenase